MILQPGNSFTVVRQIANHLDTDTNYVRAVIRNAYTDAIIATLDLTDKGSQRFKKDWQVPADPSGQGFYISVVTSVYTNSIYTTKNANYGDEENTYLVQERVMRTLGGGGGSLDAFTVRRIIKEEIGNIPAPEPIKFPKQKMPEDRTDEIITAIKGNKTEVPDVDLSPVLSKIDEVRSAIDTKDVTPETDLTPLQQLMEQEMKRLAQVFLTREDEITAKVVEGIKSEVLTQLKGIVSDTTFSMAPTTMKMNTPAAPKQEEAQPFDLKSLAL
ncbi:hypothetical protein IVB45_02230 [Bradyrhizobium sp. 4]|uniref:hypothetical protein n=1 Tax=Bradyrhizobium sp. 4 TaxID=2782678 RepID=UPI001FFE7A1A|nr:hypothetical protein [Bradyrhizobium sp. 4]UPJ35852.1 hypothetical protein IVB45_02230 [Bradyrhizobium sp. 4]